MDEKLRPKIQVFSNGRWRDVSFPGGLKVEVGKAKLVHGNDGDIFIRGVSPNEEDTTTSTKGVAEMGKDLLHQ